MPSHGEEGISTSFQHAWINYFIIHSKPGIILTSLVYQRLTPVIKNHIFEGTCVMLVLIRCDQIQRIFRLLQTARTLFCIIVTSQFYSHAAGWLHWFWGNDFSSFPTMRTQISWNTHMISLKYKFWITLIHNTLLEILRTPGAVAIYFIMMFMKFASRSDYLNCVMWQVKGLYPRPGGATV